MSRRDVPLRWLERGRFSAIARSYACNGSKLYPSRPVQVNEVDFGSVYVYGIGFLAALTVERCRSGYAEFLWQGPLSALRWDTYP